MTPSREDIITIILLASLISVIELFYYVFYNPSNIQLRTEILKLSYQFVLIVVLGGAVTFLFSRYQEGLKQLAKEKEELKRKGEEEIARNLSLQSVKRELYRKFLSEYMQAYSSVKSIRRLLKAEARYLPPNVFDSDEIMIKIGPYKKQLQALIDIQLIFERLMKEANTDLFLDVPEKDDIIQHLSKIENYLNDIIDEYESSYKILPQGDYYLLSSLPELKGFIKSAKSSPDFKGMFKAPNKEIQSIIMELLLK